ncbi:nematocyst expressed protein 4-like [Adelges cooleyi]|uniref:nematocyst expressed protein 4-like n=1 Tax=Adelges cooleyi TaxID=133065 RepID=UPI00217F6514|nr:nematocyst expressed protein 4-like [Adelges cooleyi]
MTALHLNRTLFRAVGILIISTAACWGSDPPKTYGPPPSDYSYHGYEPEMQQRPLAVFTERPVNVAGFILVPVVQVPSADLRMVYRPQIDSVSKTEPVVMCKSSTKSFEATPAIQVPLQEPFYLYDERTMIPFPKTVTILHGGYRMSIPVGVVVAPVPVGALRAGPVFVTTLYAIPTEPLPLPPLQPVRYTPWNYYPAPTPLLSTSAPSPPPPAPPQYLANPPAPAQYMSPPPPQYLSVPPSPLYYQHAAQPEGDSPDDLRNREPPNKAYAQPQSSANTFHNSKESPILNQLREESEKNRKKYPAPLYSNYHAIDSQ